MTKRKTQLAITLSLAGLLGGCSEEQVQRDIYQSQEDCLKDWQRIELCQPQEQNQQAQNGEWQSGNDPQTQEQTQAQANSNQPGVGSVLVGAAAGYMMAQAIRNYMGPSYYPSNRAVSTPTGQIVRPLGNHSTGKPMLVQGKDRDRSSSPVSRGGFSNSKSTSSGG